jgi:hypothetical protein
MRKFRNEFNGNTAVCQSVRTRSARLAARALDTISWSMFRRAISCMLAGFLIAVPMLLTAYAAQTDWLPHKIVLIAVVTMTIASVMVL